MNENNESIKSPCLGICSTVYGDNVCKGCKRFFHEVISWNAWGEKEKKVVYDRLEGMMHGVMSEKVIIANHVLLQGELIRHGIDYKHFESPYWWLYLYWVKKPMALIDWSLLGAQATRAYAHYKPSNLMNLIDDELNQEAEALFLCA